MASTELTEFWEIWSESAKAAETTGDVLFLECLDAGNSGRIFEPLPDDKLKATLSLINSILNDPKTRPKGLAIFADFLDQVNVSRLIGFQDGLISGLHLAVKGLDNSTACSLLANFLPKCHVMNEVNQTVSTTVISKILAHVCEEGQDSVSQKTADELMLAKVCLETYHGPCASYRDRLEKAFVPLLDSDNMEIVECVSEVFPLLSYAGGGGNLGERHIKDWNLMLNKFLKAAYSTLCELYGDTCFSLETENPFDGDTLPGLKRITETRPLLRMTLLKRRLSNILRVLSGYLRTSFPAPKLVPQKGVLFLIRSITSMNPIASSNSDKTVLKDVVFLTAITASIHVASLSLLRSLIYSLGSNIFVEGVTVEQILTSEFKWMQEQARSYEKLRLGLYDTLITWLRVTGGVTTNSRTLAAWTNGIGIDSRIEKDIIELKVVSKPGKSVRKNTHSSSQSIVSSSTSSQSYVQKSWTVCQSALMALIRLIPGLDRDNHRKILEHLIKTTAIIAQFQPPPPPYDNVQCRKLLFENLTSLCFYPHHLSPVSLSLVVSLLRKGTHDPEKSVSFFCSDKIAYLERLVHPIGSSMNIAGSSPESVVVFDLSSKDEVQEEDGLDNSSNVLQSESNNFEVVDITEDNMIEVDQSQQISIAGSMNLDLARGNAQLSSERIPVDLEGLRQIIKDAVSDIFKDHASSGTHLGTHASNSRAINKPVPSLNVPGTQERYGRFMKPVAGKDPSKVNGNAVSDSDTSSSDDSDIEEISSSTPINVKASAPKRVASPDVEEVNDLQTDPRKRQKPNENQTSPSVGDTTEENLGPSVEEMMSSFIDLESEPAS